MRLSAAPNPVDEGVGLGNGAGRAGPGGSRRTGAADGERSGRRLGDLRVERAVGNLRRDGCGDGDVDGTVGGGRCRYSRGVTDDEGQKASAVEISITVNPPLNFGDYFFYLLN